MREMIKDLFPIFLIGIGLISIHPGLLVVMLGIILILEA